MAKSKTDSAAVTRVQRNATKNNGGKTPKGSHASRFQSTVDKSNSKKSK